jgi:transcriptional regulator with PAS, ATPase and Fis domain
VFSVTIPPLRERTGDILPLSEYFLKQFAMRLNRRIGDFLPETRKLLESYHWPGNVRELQNEIERLVLLAEPEKGITPELLSDHVRQRQKHPHASNGNLKMAVHSLEEEMIRSTMTLYHNNKSRVARTLGISRQSLLERLKRMNIPT